MGSEPWHDANLLRELYHDKEMSDQEIANELDCGRATVSKWMRKHDIERRDRSEAISKGKIKNSEVGRYLDGDGYYRATSRFQSDNSSVLIHRLLAISEFGFGAVCGSEVHHINGLSWDNRPSNISLKTPSEHSKHHADDRWSETRPWQDEKTLRQLYIEREMSVEDIADELGCTRWTVSAWLGHHGIETRHGPTKQAKSLSWRE